MFKLAEMEDLSNSFFFFFLFELTSYSSIGEKKYLKKSYLISLKFSLGKMTSFSIIPTQLELCSHVSQMVLKNPTILKAWNTC